MAGERSRILREHDDFYDRDMQFALEDETYTQPVTEVNQGAPSSAPTPGVRPVAIVDMGWIAFRSCQNL